MNIVISKESVTRGNEATMRGRSHNVSFDGQNVSVRFRATTGVYKMNFSRKKIEEEARKAYERIMK
ncbi:MAG: hypothetical protein ACI4TW_08490 [Prevotella sp.]